jgi:hypothetical protein
VKSLICRDRQSTHGEAEDNFQNIADCWTWWLQKRKLLPAGFKITPLDVCEMMTDVKKCRKLTNLTYQDNWDDGVGYQAIGAAIAEHTNEMKDQRVETASSVDCTVTEKIRRNMEDARNAGVIGANMLCTQPQNPLIQ